MANFVTTNNRHGLAKSVCWHCVQSKNGALPLESWTTHLTWHHKADHKEYSNRHSTNIANIAKHSITRNGPKRRLTTLSTHVRDLAFL
jgi:hypothetical protein